LSLPPRDEIVNLPPCPHGGIDHAELNALGLDPARVPDFSVCTNPYRPPLDIETIMDTIDLSRYPDSTATELREQLAEIQGVPADNIIASSGTTELIRLITLTYLRPADSALVLEPTYGEYEVACRLAGSEPVRQQAREENDFAFKIDETVDLIRKHRPRLVFLCNPNNPTGHYLSRGEIEALIAATGDGLLAIDEAYVSFVEKIWRSDDLIHHGNVIILRSMTKDYGLAGLRLGYGVASDRIISNLRKACPPWNVNAIAQKVGMSVLPATDYLRQSGEKLRQGRQFLVDKLCRLGFTVLPSDTHYFLVKVGNASEFRAALLKYGIVVRDCSSLGLPEYVRIAARTMPECRRLVATIEGNIRELGYG